MAGRIIDHELYNVGSKVRYYDTMLTSNDFLETTERQNTLIVAPAEGKRPPSVFRDKYSEELEYPGIFLSQKRPGNKEHMIKVLYSEICKSELRR